MATVPRHRRLLLSSTMLVGALTGYGGRAYAACVASPSPNFVCSGANTTTQTINANDANVTTVSGFSVATTSGNAITITGNGTLKYTDDNASPLTSTAGISLSVQSGTSAATAVPGGVTIDTDGALTGFTYGIRARNYSSGVITITADGDVTATSTGTPSRGIFARNGTSANHRGSDITITTAAGHSVKGGRNGISALNYGSGATTITANGTVRGYNATGLYTISSGTDLSVTVGNTGSVEGFSNGIYARNNGSEALSIKAYGAVEGTTRSGISTVNFGTDLGITVGSSGSVKGLNNGIFANNSGNGATTITVNGAVQGYNSTGLYTIGSGTYLSVTVSNSGSVKGANNGIYARNDGTEALTITANGEVEGTTRSGISAYNYGTDLNITVSGSASAKGLNNGIFANNKGSGALTVTTGEGTQVNGNTAGIRAWNYSSQMLTITTAGNVTGGSSDGIYAYSAGSPIAITVRETGSVTSAGTDAFAIFIEGGAGNLTVAGTLNGGGGNGGAVSFNPVTVRDDRLTLAPSATVTGNVLAGPGTDTLALGGSGEGAFNLNNIDTGANTQQFQSFEVFEVESGDWSFTGTTTASFTVNGGTVMGTGTFGDLTFNGGTLAPGNSIGTMTVNGAFTLAAGAVYEVEVNAAGQSDKVIANGAVNLTGATLRVLAANGDYKTSTDYTIIENDGADAVIGKFSTVTSSLAFLTPTVFYSGGDGNDVVLNLSRNETLFSDVARTRNQRAVAGALEQFPTDNALFLAVLNQTASGARQAFDALSGEIHATVAGTLADDSRYVREAVLGRLMQASHAGGNMQVAALAAAGPQVASLDSPAMALGYGSKSLSESMPPYEPAPLAFWTRAYGAWGDFNGDGNAATADRDLGGFISGMDAQISGSWRVGLATGASFSNVGVSDRYSSADVESYHLGGYLGGMAGAFALRGGGMWAWNDVDTSRAVIFPGFFERQKASYDADTGQIFGEVAYPTQMMGLAVEPFGGLAFVSIDTDSFRERGGALASLRGSSTDEEVGYSTLGLRAATTMHWGATLVTPHVSAAWQHAFDDVTPGAALAFASTGIGFGIEGVPLAEDSALIDAGLDFALGENTTAGVSYTGQFGDGVSDNGVKGRFTWLF